MSLKTLESGYHQLDIGDNVQDPSNGHWGSVVRVDPDLVILWPDNEWEIAGMFEQNCKLYGTPYRIRRQDWDFELLQDGTYNEYLDAADDD